MRYIARLREQDRLGQNITYIFNRILKWLALLVVAVIIITRFEINIEAWVVAMAAILGGSIIGYASMNTLGNALAGVIIMISRPFKIGDRVYRDGFFADVVAVELIYTRFKTLDNTLLSVPNQNLITTGIENYGKRTVVRRSCAISVGYEEAPEEIERVLLVASGKIEGVVKEPKPYVWLTKMSDVAAEYTLYVFTDQVKRIDKFDADLNLTVLDVCNKNGIDLRTPAMQRLRGP